MYKKKKKDKKIKIITAVVIALVAGFILNIFITNRNLTIFEKAIKDSLLTVQEIVFAPFKFIGSTFMDVSEQDKINEEYEKLKQEIESVNNLKSQIDELNYQLDTLQELTGLNELFSDYEIINASVINRDLSYWNDTVTINKGEYDGITVDMGVIVSDGLVGKVISTTSFNSTIRLIKSGIDRISVKIEYNDQYTYGIISNFKDDKFIIEGISDNILIENGATVTTTGMGDIFPSGIKIGTVSNITTDTFDLAAILEVESSVNFDNINYVSVLKRGVE